MTKNPEKSRDFSFKNPGILSDLKSRDPGIPGIPLGPGDDGEVGEDGEDDDLQVPCALPQDGDKHREQLSLIILLE